jgi:hypothetical protein
MIQKKNDERLFSRQIPIVGLDVLRSDAEVSDGRSPLPPPSFVSVERGPNLGDLIDLSRRCAKTRTGKLVRVSEKGSGAVPDPNSLSASGHSHTLVFTIFAERRLSTNRSGTRFPPI